MPVNFTIKIRNGQAEFEEKSIQKLAKALLKELKPLLKRPKPEKALRNKAKNGRRGRKPKPSYPQDAIKPLKASLRKDKPKTKLDLALSIAKHHLQHFKVESFTNKDLTNAAAAIGKKLGNVSALLRTAIKANRIKKLGKGTWQLLTDKAPVSKAVKKAKPKKAANAKPAPKPKPKKVAVRIKAKPAAKPQPKKSAAKPKAKPTPKPEPKSEPAKGSESTPF